MCPLLMAPALQKAEPTRRWTQFPHGGSIWTGGSRGKCRVSGKDYPLLVVAIQVGSNNLEKINIYSDLGGGRGDVLEVSER